MREDADSHHARPLAHFGLEGQRVADAQAGHVDDVLAVVRHQRQAVLLAHLGNATHGRELAHHAACSHRNHLHRQREGAQRFYQLGGIGDADELARLGGHDLLACKCRAAALHHEAAVIDFVGTVDVDGQFLDLVAVEHRDAQRPQALGGGNRAGNGALDLVLDRRQRVDELVHRGAGADADDLALDHVGQSGMPDQGLEFVLGQGAGSGGWGGGCGHRGESLAH